MMNFIKAVSLMISSAFLISACAVAPPTAPSVLVLPGTGKGFEEFRTDNEVCKQFASEQIGRRSSNEVYADSGARSAAVGTLLGAAAGAAINGSRGASAGAGGGLALGGLAGVGAAEDAAGRLQQRYDIGYQQCMYAKGHRIPASRGLLSDFFHGQPARSRYLER